MKKGTVILGTEAFKSFLSAVFANLKVDKNEDGEISTAEWTQAAFGILPSFLNPQLIAEARDLTRPEVKSLVEWAKIQFPAISQLKTEVEDVVVATLNVIIATEELFASVQNLKKSVEPASEAAADPIFKK
jgi:hypothetical protein